MIQEKVKSQLEQVKKQREQVQSQLQKVLASSKEETQRILKELGVDSDLNSIQLSELITSLRKSNPDIKTFLRNLNVATYDTRFRLNWNSNMISAYTKKQAEKAYIKDLKPKFESLTGTLNEQLKELQLKTQEIRAKLGN